MLGHDKTYRVASNSIIAFGGALFVSSIVAAFLHGALVIDFAAPIVIGLGASISGHGRSAAKWALAIMAVYLFIAMLLIVAIAVGSEKLRMAGRPFRLEDRPWALAVTLVVAAWVLVNIGLLVRLLRKGVERSAA